MSMTIHQTITHIDRTFAQLLTEYEAWFRIDAALLRFRPIAGWSIEQILEHVTLTNHFLLILIRKGTRRAVELAAKTGLNQALAGYQYHLGALDDIANHQSFKWTRPEHMEPAGDKSLNEVRALWQGQIAECRALLQAMPNGEGLLYKTTMSVNNLGKIDVYQYVYFLGLHARRHLAQMQRVKDEFDGHSHAELKEESK